MSNTKNDESRGKECKSLLLYGEEAAIEYGRR